MGKLLEMLLNPTFNPPHKTLSNSSLSHTTTTKLTMKSHHSSIPILLLLLPLSLLLHAPPTSAQYSTTADDTTMTDFKYIKDQCNATLYPDVCYTSLSRYASAISRDSAQLARVAVGVSLSRARHASSYLSNLTRHSDFSPDPRLASAVRDCSSTFSDAVDQMRGSLSQMRQLGGAGEGSEALRFQLSNVQTWMSAALTNEDTCTDGFEGVADGEMKSEVCGKVTKVRKITSNALALVNTYASSLN